MSKCDQHRLKEMNVDARVLDMRVQSTGRAIEKDWVATQDREEVRAKNERMRGYGWGGEGMRSGQEDRRSVV